MTPRTHQIRRISFLPGSSLGDFLSKGYTTKGVATASLKSLLPVYPSTTLTHVANLQRLISTRAVRRGDIPSLVVESPLVDVMFKKFGPHLPFGVTKTAVLEFFTDQFHFNTHDSKEQFIASTSRLILNPHYHILAITAPMFLKKGEKLHHFIIAAVLYMYNNKNGSYVATIAVTNKGYPNFCTLSQHCFIDPTTPSILLDTSSFRGHGFGTFLLCMVQTLGFLGYKMPGTGYLSDVPFHIQCNEHVGLSQMLEQKHHIYLQAHVEHASAYVMYVKLGFRTLAVSGSNYHCKSFPHECPVNRDKKFAQIGDSYHTDADCLRLLVLKHWLYNVYPPDSSLPTGVVEASHIWNARGLSGLQYLSSALVPPTLTEKTRKCTNMAYFKLLECQRFLGASPLVVSELSSGTTAMSLPVDWTKSTERTSKTRIGMVSGPTILRNYIRRPMFCSLEAHVAPNYDAFDLLVAPMYTEGNFATMGNHTFSHSEMVSEVRLNLEAFYRRCSHFPFIVSSLETWSKFAIMEFDDLLEADLTGPLGLADFNGELLLCHANCLVWSHNYKILAN